MPMFTTTFLRTTMQKNVRQDAFLTKGKPCSYRLLGSKIGERMRPYHTQPNCPFCNQDNPKIVLVNAHAYAIFDGYPVSHGHSLVIPKRHIASFFEATREEQSALLDLLAEMQQILMKEHNPDGFNIGINVGEAAGQTVMHLHIHLIPRYAGDQPDPRGGVRWIFPEKADYWSNRK